MFFIILEEILKRKHIASLIINAFIIYQISLKAFLEAFFSELKWNLNSWGNIEICKHTHYTQNLYALLNY